MAGSYSRSRFVVLALGVIAVASSVVASIGHGIANVARSVYDNWMHLTSPELPRQTQTHVVPKRLAMHAKWLVRNERMVLTPTWRMCPSV